MPNKMLNKISELHKICFPHKSWGAEEFAALQRGGAEIIASEHGFIVWRCAADECEIITIGVHPDHRGAGIASTLLTLMEKELKKRGTFPSFGGVSSQSDDGVVYQDSDRCTINYYSLPHNPRLKLRARELRKAGSLPEALFWNQIKTKKLNKLDFDRQKIIGNYIVDFYCASNRLVIEIDDKASHDSKYNYDLKRDEYLKSLGLTVIHIPAESVLKNPVAVFESLVNHPGALSGATPPKEGNPPCDRFQQILQRQPNLQIKILLEVAADNAPARKLYEKYGYAQVGIRPKYYNGTDAILMQKVLDI
jgi:very-short-patch-repair endonuclease/GNAT superfamily N-acetyltransferase